MCLIMLTVTARYRRKKVIVSVQKYFYCNCKFNWSIFNATLRRFNFDIFRDLIRQLIQDLSNVHKNARVTYRVLNVQSRGKTRIIHIKRHVIIFAEVTP